MTDLYYKLSDRTESEATVQLATFRTDRRYEAFVLGEEVEKL